MTVRRAALIAAALAVLAQANALGNGFALDDVQIIQRNPVAHSVAQAARAAFHPYWPREHGAGLWRPLTLLSFAADWQLSGGSAAWLHGVNLLLNALAAALVVLFLARYAGAAGALAGGAIFAVHPVHVEAVANLVGRAELLAACGILSALLVARRIRERAAASQPAPGLELLLALCLLAALLSKEHAVITAALLWLDDRARPKDPGRLPLRVYAVAVLITAAWLAARHVVDRGSSFAYVAPAFIHLDTLGRLDTMMPVVLIVVRLLVWPWQLSWDYRPQVVERLDHVTPQGVVGFVTLLALAGLAVLAWRRSRPAAAGILIILLAWLPSSNLLFPTGIVVSERTLYLATVGLALLAALAFQAAGSRLAPGRAFLVVAALCLPLAARTWTRVSVWRGSRELILNGLLEHPESYAIHQSIAHTEWLLGRRDVALSEYETASELFPLDPFLEITIADAARLAGRPSQAIRHALAAERLDSSYAGASQTLIAAVRREPRAARH